MTKKINQILVLSASVFFLACGASTNERGITSTTTDKTASGSAYNSYDGFAPKASTVTASAPVASVSPAAAVNDTVVAVVPGATVPPVVGTPPNAPVVAAKPAAIADDGADIKKGEALISKSDCVGCHQVNVKVLGPSYKDVATKYPNNAATISMLANKIKNGGSGVWGEIPMSPHPALSDADAKAMVKYILSLK